MYLLCMDSSKRCASATAAASLVTAVNAARRCATSSSLSVQYLRTMAYAPTHTHTNTHTHIHARTHARTHVHEPAQQHARTQTRERTHTHTHTHTHPSTHARAHTRAHTHARTQKHAHARTIKKDAHVLLFHGLVHAHRLAFPGYLDVNSCRHEGLFSHHRESHLARTRQRRLLQLAVRLVLGDYVSAYRLFIAGEITSPSDSGLLDLADCRGRTYRK